MARYFYSVADKIYRELSADPTLKDAFDLVNAAYKGDLTKFKFSELELGKNDVLRLRGFLTALSSRSDAAKYESEIRLARNLLSIIKVCGYKTTSDTSYVSSFKEGEGIFRNESDIQ